MRIGAPFISSHRRRKKKLSKRLIIALQHNDKGDFPYEYVEMKMCERFRMSPFEFRKLPQRFVKTWLQMMAVEQGVAKTKEPQE